MYLLSMSFFKSAFFMTILMVTSTYLLAMEGDSTLCTRDKSNLYEVYKTVLEYAIKSNRFKYVLHLLRRAYWPDFVCQEQINKLKEQLQEQAKTYAEQNKVSQSIIFDELLGKYTPVTQLLEAYIKAQQNKSSCIQKVAAQQTQTVQKLIIHGAQAHSSHYRYDTSFKSIKKLYVNELWVELLRKDLIAFDI